MLAIDLAQVGEVLRQYASQNSLGTLSAIREQGLEHARQLVNERLHLNLAVNELAELRDQIAGDAASTVVSIGASTQRFRQSIDSRGTSATLGGTSFEDSPAVLAVTGALTKRLPDRPVLTAHESSVLAVQHRLAREACDKGLLRLVMVERLLEPLVQLMSPYPKAAACCDALATCLTMVTRVLAAGELDGAAIALLEEKFAEFGKLRPSLGFPKEFNAMTLDNAISKVKPLLRSLRADAESLAVTGSGASAGNRSLQELLTRASRLGFPADDVSAMLRRIRQSAVTLNLPPDCIPRLLETGRYQTFMETKSSKMQTGTGELAHKNFLGQEHFLFGDVSFSDDEHPKYAAPNVFGSCSGAAPGYGSCFIELREEAKARCTLGPASGMGPIASFDCFEHLLTLQADEAFCRVMQATLGRAPNTGINSRFDYGPLEAHVFGEVRLDRDVSRIGAPNGLREQPAGKELQIYAAKCGLAVTWY